MMPHYATRHFAIIGAGLLAFALVASGVWLPKLPPGGLTQVGRRTSLSFEDGTVLTLDEPETDREVHRRRRMAGFHPHEFKQIFILADGREMDVEDDWTARQSRDDEEGVLAPSVEDEEKSLRRPGAMGDTAAALPAAPASPEAIDGLRAIARCLAEGTTLDKAQTPAQPFSWALWSAPNGDLWASDWTWPSQANLAVSADLSSLTPEFEGPLFAGVGAPLPGGVTSNFRAPSGVSAVPEPTTLPLLALAGLTTWLAMSRRRANGSSGRNAAA